MHIETLPMDELIKLITAQLEQGEARLTVTGDSMYPTLHHRRDAVILQKPDRPLKKGDLILYVRRNGQYILHRIVALRPGGFVCCGDNQWQREDIEPDQVIAIVTCLRRMGKTVPVTDPGYERRVRLWVAMMPLRRPVLWARRRCGSVKRMIKKKTQKRC